MMKPAKVFGQFKDVGAPTRAASVLAEPDRPTEGARVRRRHQRLELVEL